MANPYLTPAALVLGSCIIAGALYMGLTHRLGPSDDAVTAATTAARTAVPRPANRVTKPRRVFSKAETQESARLALALAKARWLEICWKPALAKNPKPDKARWEFDMTFATSGVEIARGISDVRGAERPDVGACLRRQPIGLRVPPPQKNTRVTLELTMP